MGLIDVASEEDGFEFLWQLHIVLDKNVTALKNVSMSLTELQINPNMSDEKKKRVRAVVSQFVL
jgi:hypothetical protein